MNAKAPAEMMLGWRLEKCGDTNPLTGIEEARFLLDAHSGHNCRRYLAGLGYATAVM